jgi:hypothetical protein
MKTCVENVALISDLRGLPAPELSSVILQCATPAILLRIQNNTQQIATYTEPIWQTHCTTHFKILDKLPEMSWKQTYAVSLTILSTLLNLWFSLEIRTATEEEERIEHFTIKTIEK